MKSRSNYFVILLLFYCSISVNAQSAHPNRSYQASINYSLVNQNRLLFHGFLIHFNQGFHGEKGGSFLYEASYRKTDLLSEIELSTFYRKSYIRKEKLEAYLGLNFGARVFEPKNDLAQDIDNDFVFFMAGDIGYQIFFNKNTALEWNVSFPFTFRPYESMDIKGYHVGRLNTTLRLRYFLKSQKNENISPNEYRLYKNKLMIGGSMELGKLNEFDHEGRYLQNILKPVFGFMVNNNWMIGSGIQISSNRSSDLIYFGGSVFSRIYMSKTSTRAAFYWEVWTLLMNKADRPTGTNDFELFTIGAGNGFGLGYWLSPNVVFNFSSGLQLFKDLEEHTVSISSPSRNLFYFRIGMETFL